jgi:hypothetical protein
MENVKKVKKRNGVLIGAYIPAGMKFKLQQMAKKQHLTVSQLLVKIFHAEINKQERSK